MKQKPESRERKAFGSEGTSSRQNCLAGSSKRIQDIYRQLLNYIHENRLQPGDLLPSHEELRHTIQTGSNTLYQALTVLVNDGVLERVRGTGTRLLRTDIVSQQTWTIGIPVFNELSYGFRPMLEHYMRRALLQNGCSDRSYLSLPGVKDETRTLKPDDFAGLTEDIKAGKVDGILTFSRLKGDQIPICTIAHDAQKAMSVKIDDNGFALDATTELRARGMQQIAIIGPSKYNLKRKAHFKKVKFNDADIVWLDQDSIGGIDAGIEVATRLSPLVRENKIDGIVILDETMANTIIQILNSQGISAPALAVQANKQIPVPLIAETILRFELDIQLLADTAVQMLVEKLLNPKAEIKHKTIRPQLIEN